MKNANLSKVRKSRNMTQEQLADLLGCQKGTVSNWENGYSNPSLADAFRVSEILKEDVNKLFSHLKVQENHTFVKGKAIV